MTHPVPYRGLLGGAAAVALTLSALAACSQPEETETAGAFPQAEAVEDPVTTPDPNPPLPPSDGTAVPPTTTPEATGTAGSGAVNPTTGGTNPPTLPQQPPQTGSPPPPTVPQ